MQKISSAGLTPTLFVPLFAAAIICVLVQALAWMFPEVMLRPFAWGAAHLAAAIFHCPIEMMSDHWRLHTEPIGQIVHEGCSGYTYFTLLCMLGTFLVWSRSADSITRKLTTLVGGLPIAVGIAILVTTGRIFCSFQVRIHTMGLIPDNFQPATHLVTGLCITISTLVLFATVWCMTWKHKSLITTSR
jgi:exosortase/archaeosortase family protein